jgi:outer membrane protein OmpA-like peptidoglycan-associated protein
MMKTYILTFWFSVFCVLFLSAAPLPQGDSRTIRVADAGAVRSAAGNVEVTFTLHVGGEVTARNRSLVIRPMLRGAGGQQIELSPVIVRGLRSPVSDENVAMSAVGIPIGEHLVTSNGKSLVYRVSIPWQTWMNGSQLMLVGLNTGGGVATEVEIGVVADNLQIGPMSNMRSVSESAAGMVSLPNAHIQVPALNSPDLYDPAIDDYSGFTIGDELASRFTFVEPAEIYNRAIDASPSDAVFDYNMPLVFSSSTKRPDDDVNRFIEMTRNGALHVQFERGSVVLSRDVGQNNNVLVDLISAIRALDSNPQVRISQVIIVGFSAPEGSLGEKETLALERAAVTRDFLTANSRIDPAVIAIYNGAVDWPGLRALVAESDMPDKFKVLDLIDNIPAWGNTRDKDRLAYLTELNNGEPLRYIRENLFPLLRQTGAYIKIYYENAR